LYTWGEGKRSVTCPRSFEDANQLTRFVDDGVAFSLVITPRLPGRCCSS
jgi:hypothetical protein